MAATLKTKIMNKIKVISRKNLPVRLGLTCTAVGYLLLDKFHSPEWVWTLWIVCISITYAIKFFLLYQEEGVDILEKEQFKDLFNKFKSKIQP